VKKQESQSHNKSSSLTSALSKDGTDHSRVLTTEKLFLSKNKKTWTYFQQQAHSTRQFRMTIICIKTFAVSKQEDYWKQQNMEFQQKKVKYYHRSNL